MAFVIIAIRSVSHRLLIDADRVTLEGWRGQTIARASRATALAAPGVFFHTIFLSDSTIESDSPMLTLELEARVVTLGVT